MLPCCNFFSCSFASICFLIWNEDRTLQKLPMSEAVCHLLPAAVGASWIKKMASSLDASVPSSYWTYLHPRIATAAPTAHTLMCSPEGPGIHPQPLGQCVFASDVENVHDTSCKLAFSLVFAEVERNIGWAKDMNWACFFVYYNTARVTSLQAKRITAYKKTHAYRVPLQKHPL